MYTLILHSTKYCENFNSNHTLETSTWRADSVEVNTLRADSYTYVICMYEVGLIIYLIY